MDTQQGIVMVANCYLVESATAKAYHGPSFALDLLVPAADGTVGIRPLRLVRCVGFRRRLFRRVDERSLLCVRSSSICCNIC